MEKQKGTITDLFEKALTERLDEAERRKIEAHLNDCDDETRHEFEALNTLRARLERAAETFQANDTVQYPDGMASRILERLKIKAVPACLDRIQQAIQTLGFIPVWAKTDPPAPILLPSCGYRLVFDSRKLSVRTWHEEAEICYLIIRAEPVDGDNHLVTPVDLIESSDYDEEEVKVVFTKQAGYYKIETEPARLSGSGVEWRLKASDIMHSDRDRFRLSLSTYDRADQMPDTDVLARVAGTAPDAIDHLTQMMRVEDEAVDEGYVCYYLLFDGADDEEFDEYTNAIMRRYHFIESQKVAGLRGLYLTMPNETAEALQSDWKRRHTSAEELK